MKRAVAGVIIGYLVWTALWLGGNALFFSAAAVLVKTGHPYTAVGPLSRLILLSVVCSLAAGVTAALISTARARGAVLVMAVLLLGTGIAVQIGIGSLMPALVGTLMSIWAMPGA